MSGFRYYRHPWTSARSIALVLSVLATTVQAEDDADAIARELANPNTSLGFLAVPIDYVSYKGDAEGADNEEAWRFNFQPVLPYPLAERTNLFFRPLIPIVVDQPIPFTRAGDTPPPDDGDFTIDDADFDSSGTELGDISFDIAIGHTFTNGVSVIGGMVGTLDTATDDRVGLGQTLLGPELAVTHATSWGLYGLLVTHQWDVAGDDDFDTSITGGQYFFTYNLKNGWQIQTSPTWSYNHEAASGEEKWTFPLGTGVSKTTKLGNTPVKFSLEYWHFIKQADAIGPDYQVRFKVTPVVPLPW